jgi:hypothetical protein
MYIQRKKKTHRSTTDFVFQMSTRPTSWYSKLQHSIFISTGESEYYGIEECSKQCVWNRNIS